jgi:methionyl-tRNA formyltransferase
MLKASLREWLNSVFFADEIFPKLVKLTGQLLFNCIQDKLTMTTAVVFAYHNVGVRCLSVLLAHGIDVKLVFTHEDDPKEQIWFGSVTQLCNEQRLRAVTPKDANTVEWIETLKAIRPDFIFSFYYRHMLKSEILACATHGAYNMHGSLLPKYRGRVPVNWAIIHGESETGATLHQMLVKPDAGAIATQQSVPILPNDTAFDVFQKVTVAAELALDKVLPSIVDGSVQLIEQDLSHGSYFGGRKAEDGRINWQQNAGQIHNLIRAVAPPYPGAYAEIAGKTVKFLRSRVLNIKSAHPSPCFYWTDNRLQAALSDGSVLEILQAEYDGKPLDMHVWEAIVGKPVYNLT